MLVKMQVLKISKKLGFLKPPSKSYKICRFKSDSKLIVSFEERKTLHLMEIPAVTIKDFNDEKMVLAAKEMNNQMKKFDSNWNDWIIWMVKISVFSVLIIFNV